MRLVYTHSGGSYTHQDDSLYSQVHWRNKISPTFTVYGSTMRWDIVGRIKADSQADLKTAIAALEAAYAFQGGDLVLYHNDNTTVSAHAIYSASSYSGLRVTGLEWLMSRETEYLTRRSYHLTVEADYITGASGTILEWVERITRVGDGGPMNVWQTALTALPQKQTVKQYTTYQVIQSGHAIGLDTYPTPATPIWPAHEHGDRRQIDYQTPTITPQSFYGYPVTWRYTFEGSTSFAGDPTDPF